MREYAQKPENKSRTLDSNPRAFRQAPISEILQSYRDRTFGKPVQQSADEDELLQGKFDTAQCKDIDEEEILQGKFKVVQREEFDEDEILQEKFESISTAEQVPIQHEEKPNNTGLSDNLKSGIENLSGYSMDDVKVHYNSDKPAQLNALAYAQGTDIHVAPGQEKHLPHEAWHVVQQKQGRVQSTMQLQGVNMNDNKGLEKEADMITGSIMQVAFSSIALKKALKNFQLEPYVIQRQLPKFENEKAAIIYFEDTMLEDIEKHRYDLDLLKKIATQSGWDDLLERIAYYSSNNKTLIELQIKELDLTDSNNFEAIKKLLDIVHKNEWDDLEDEILPAFRKLEDDRDDFIEYQKEKRRQCILNDGASLFNAATNGDFVKAVKTARDILRLLPHSKTDGKTLQTKADFMNALGDYKRPFANLIFLHIFASNEQLCTFIANYIEKNEKCHEDLKKVKDLDYTKEDNRKKAAKEIVEKAKTWLGEQFKSPEGIQNLVNLTHSQVQELTVSRDKSSQEAIDKRMEEGKFNEVLSKLKSKEKSKVQATTIKHLFDDNPDLSAEALKIHKGEIHPTLKAISDDNPHSITDVNDYVGDKLEDPLMSWIIQKKIRVEVHATSLLASFAQLNSEGFTDIIKIPSTHEGTSKYIAYHPEKKHSKIVFQTMPGKSYQIQTTGAFLFYELYDFDNNLCSRVENPKDEAYKYEQYKAIKILKKEEKDTIKRALYLLVDEKTGKKLLAEVPFITTPFKITDGAIMLQGFDVKCINIRKIERLNPEQLTIFEEEIDYKEMYVNALKTGIEKIDIAALGGSGDLERVLSKKVKPFRQISLLQFNAKLYKIQNEEKQEFILFSCQISPHFFGDRAGKLVEALKELKVKHLIFTGTAGGLAQGLEVGDIVVPDSVENYSEADFTEKQMVNEGKNVAEDIKVESKKLKIGGRHVGVHSPITESKTMIDELKEQKIKSIDCEGGFIADALAESDVSLYQYLYISDVPGTEDSIGKGGLAVKKTSEKPEVTTISLILKTIEKIIGGEISEAQRKTENVPYSINGNSIKAENGTIRVNIILPEVSEVKGKITGVLNLLGELISKILVYTKGLINLAFQQKIIALTQDFYNTHQIKISVNFELNIIK